MDDKLNRSVVVIVAHPDDEILWAGGTILNNPQWDYFIISLCRKNDEDRSSKFYKVLKILNAQGILGNLDDGPEQKPLDAIEVEQYLLDLWPQKHFDLIITHSPQGEYTKHLRHEEVSKAVIMLWNEGKINADALWVFAYEDGEKKYFPRAIKSASYFETLRDDIWIKKYKIITETYGFEENSWEAKTTPKMEAFWVFKDPNSAVAFLNK
ncbi:PIG-L family deacetylase [Flavobacterium aquariorum]|uniref:PIG-L family deacetylase n=1 Tax=Flavobacterium aquariorum TaxID=2217670 RepID=A0A2W7TS21_9FLAO|nr:PIG-L family deacetylase [Flavobacterium aquariorum]PZX93011.1 PIG-L family deacetylase [Flavobacterium aquariorum]